MKIRKLLSMAVLTLLAAVAYAGQVQPAPVIVDSDLMLAQGDQYTARTAADDVSFIGCGVRVFDDGVNSLAFGFCQAGDSDENGIVCTTQNPNLLNAMGAGNDFSFITFSWRDDGNGGAECIRIGYSTQSFYLPNFTTKGSK